MEICVFTRQKLAEFIVWASFSVQNVNFHEEKLSKHFSWEFAASFDFCGNWPVKIGQIGLILNENLYFCETEIGTLKNRGVPGNVEQILLCRMRIFVKKNIKNFSKLFSCEFAALFCFFMMIDVLVSENWANLNFFPLCTWMSLTAW